MPDTPSRTTIVVGGTAGIGAGIARARLAAGDDVTIVGRDEARGRAFVEVAGTERAGFVAGDLRTARGTWAVVDELLTRHPVIDSLVLSAYAPQLARRINDEGVELSLALYYVARRVLGEGLAGALLASRHPLVLSLNGVGAVRGAIAWDDLTLRRGWNAVRATKQAGRAAELLGVAQAALTPRIAYVMFHPGYTHTGATGLPPAARLLANGLGALFAQPVERAIHPVLHLFEQPPADPLTAVDRGRPVPLDAFADPDAAMRLHAVMTDAVRRRRG
jgi:NAD(P)-dependent dehydrogenase (short-subunit alcohol dehydrogenase family)